MKLLACALTGFLAVDLAAVRRGEAFELTTGNYSFSDELGGFRLISAVGTGTRDDPVIVVEEFEDVLPVTLTVRRLHPLRGDTGHPGGLPMLVVVKRVVNRSKRVWAGFEVELQEILHRPSNYGDGLSFNQYGAEASDIWSDSFAENDRKFEPFDRILFQTGHVDPEAIATFKLTITDPTPTSVFYIVQDPKILSAGLPSAQGFAAR